MSKPRLLDLFCGAGGAAMGYARAGFEVVGVDIAPQKHYPFEFHQADALTYPLEGFDVIHASPPCQHYSRYSCNLHTAHKFPDLVAPVRERLMASGTPWIIENVVNAPLQNPLMLCGSMFGLNVRRHRLFESPWLAGVLFAPFSCKHDGIPMAVYGHGTPQWHRKKLGRNATVADWREAMGIEWMIQRELAQAIPPAYTEWIGHQLMTALTYHESTGAA